VISSLDFRASGDVCNRIANACERVSRKVNVALLAPPPRPPRVIVDMSGGVFHGAKANAPVDVLVIDRDDAANPRAIVPRFSSGDPPAGIWASLVTAEIDRCAVNVAFAGIIWLPPED
jgi:hypothetical protein